MPHVLGDRTAPRIETNRQRTLVPRAIIAYAIICIIAAAFVIASALITG